MSGDPVSVDTATLIDAEKAIIPSTPRLTLPLLSTTNSPRAASIIGMLVIKAIDM
jgi:hypothetical protein